MDWQLLMQDIAANWIPLTITLIIGFFFGWLFLARPAKKRTNQAAARAAELESSARAADRDLTAARKELETAKAQLQSAQGDLDTARQKLSSVEADMSVASQEKETFESEMAAARDNFAQSEETRETELQSLSAQVAALAGEIAVARSELEAAQTEARIQRQAAESSGKALVSKETALSEAYTHVAKLQQSVADKDRVMNTAQSELAELRQAYEETAAEKLLLERRLQQVRGEVAGEMALLTSTMIREKDAVLAEANARILALSGEIQTLKAGWVSES